MFGVGVRTVCGEEVWGGGCISHEAFHMRQGPFAYRFHAEPVVWAFCRVHMASLKNCIVHEAFVKHLAGSIWQARKVAFCMRHS